MLISEEHMLKDSLSLYNEVQRDSKNNEEMMDYTHRLSRHLGERMKCFQELKARIELYQYHLREHEACEAKLIEASEAVDRYGVGMGSLESSGVGLWV